MWKIEPQKAIGPFGLGEKINEVKEHFGNGYEVFKRVPDADDTVLAYDQYSVHLTYGQDDRIKIITVFRPNEAEYKHTQLIGKLLENARKDLLDIGIVVVEVEAGLWVKEAGILFVEVDGIVDGIELYSDKSTLQIINNRQE